jgi:hypothetical protein
MASWHKDAGIWVQTTLVALACVPPCDRDPLSLAPPVAQEAKGASTPHAYTTTTTMSPETTNHANEHEDAFSVNKGTFGRPPHICI